MMLVGVSSNKGQFKTVRFKKGFNVILADTAKGAGRKDSRNGVGKSSLINIIHFCLGANVTEGKGISRKELSGWDFTLEVIFEGESLFLTREVDDHSKIFVKYKEINKLPVALTEEDNGRYSLSADQLNKLLGNIFFGLPTNVTEKYSPSSRMLLSYIARKGLGAYAEPFKYFSMQSSWQIQVSQTFLLGLSYKIAQEIALCREEEKALKELKASIDSGVLESIVGDIGKLEAEKIQLDDRIDKNENQLGNFKVHPQYRDIEKQVDNLTSLIHSLTNKNILNRDLLNSLKKSSKSEATVDSSLVKKMYEEAGAVFKEDSINSLEEVINFHITLIENRKEFLKDELKRLNLDIESNLQVIEEKTQKRAELMSILDDHSAFEDMVNLRNLQTGLVSKSKALATRIKDLKKIRNSEQGIKLKKDSISLKANKDYDDREEDRKKVIKVFAENTSALYGNPGDLIINIDANGYKFNVDIERDGSAGVSKMEVFCYDLMLAEIWSDKNIKPGFLVHDSTIFSDVDERQISSALNLAKRKSSKFGFQYICFMNSDKIPGDLKAGNSNIIDDIVLTLSDSPESECLFGFRF